ncbi:MULTISPECIES: prolyl-tRNA synthetase associated domain-containing protein [unclassified Ruegeria]|uniref:prolyl-tRNA synthetase associated domain-containing protein n=1 Tax=unclassified Ruegeria TaxID=2625375 RepID=UPI0014896B78|nr:MULTISPECIES: prolyl-tRNA synthetase associated domain-containing protein [unclassified Ruegeria]NOD90698.1 prolyl-tRNA synthetase associated domain-containing protein [Ruegeria sp. HKCCD4318]NOE15799.1 prolyl-tRNA synthetase associated domain-containing protein [Ruegeria sp. HKCCD4318-2]NOG07928.1 prolyl-tRNA synthetase associated domain-containing protein [Ruegeria sp. HKCCD4315]
MDASSAFQGTLPLTSDALLAQLDDWGLAYRLHTHVPLRTVEDSKAVEDQFMVPGENALRVKNLYLRDKKKRNYLVTLEQNREIDLKALGAELGVGNLSFGSADRLMQNLGIRPGAVSPLAMINGVQNNVRFFMDAAAKQAEVIYMHPLVNDRTVALKRADVMAFFDHIGCEVTWLP